VGFFTDWAKSTLLKNCRYLAETELANVSIVPDLTEKQRRMEREIMQEAERRNLEDLTDEERAKNVAWKVVGKKGQRRLIKGSGGWERVGRGGGVGAARGRGAERGGMGVGPALLPSRGRAGNWQPSARAAPATRGAGLATRGAAAPAARGAAPAARGAAPGRGRGVDTRKRQRSDEEEQQRKRGTGMRGRPPTRARSMVRGGGGGMRGGVGRGEGEEGEEEEESEEEIITVSQIPAQNDTEMLEEEGSQEGAGSRVGEGTEEQEEEMFPPSGIRMGEGEED
jgi:hypothetical protein